MKKQTALSVLIAVALSLAIVLGVYQLGYRPVKEKTEALQKKTDALQPLYDAYLASDKNVPLWRDALGEDGAGEKKKYPKQISQREQLELITSLEARFGFEAANIRFGAKNTTVSEQEGIYAKTLIFDYRVASMEVFGELLGAVRGNGTLPVSVSYFTMRADTDAALRGELHLQIYFTP